MLWMMSEVSLTMPSKIALSGGIGEARKWLVGGKIAMQNQVK
jgi:hypothetical protein